MLLQLSWPYIHHWVGVKRPELLVEVILFLSLLDTCILYVFCFVRFFSLRLWETYSGHLHEKNIKLNIRKNLWPTPCFCYYIMNVDSDSAYSLKIPFFIAESCLKKKGLRISYDMHGIPLFCSQWRHHAAVRVHARLPGSRYISRLSSPPYPVLAHR